MGSVCPANGMVSAQLGIAGSYQRIRSTGNPRTFSLVKASRPISRGLGRLRKHCGWISARNDQLGSFELEEEELVSESGDSKLEFFEEKEEDLTEEWFEEDSIPGSQLQETVALALAAVVAASALNILFRLLVVLVSLAATGFKYIVIGILLVFISLFVFIR